MTKGGYQTLEPKSPDDMAVTVANPPLALEIADIV
jgi:hypothetical protein